MRFFSIVGLIMLLSITSFAQIQPYKFGDGFRVNVEDPAFSLRFGFRFQNLFVNEWDVADGNLENYQAAFLVRRSRLKFDGYAYSPKLKYKLELGLTNRDISGGDGDEYRNASRVVLDAYLDWNFFENFSLKVGQAKLPGNRERVISSADLQFVDRSRLNSRFNIDRDVGIQLKHELNVGEDFIIKEIASISQGEGRNITAGHFDGFDYTFRLEFLPMGSFASKGDYVGAAITRENKPKLAIGITYDINKNSVKERGQLGSFITYTDTSTNSIKYLGKDLETLFADLMYKHDGLSIMAEYAKKMTSDDNPIVLDEYGEEAGTFFTGSAISAQAGYMFKSNWEIAGRYTMITPDEKVGSDEAEYTLGISKYVVGHKLKIQSDLSYRDVSGKDGLFTFRLQTDIHF